MITLGSLVEVPLLPRSLDWVTPYVIYHPQDEDYIRQCFFNEKFLRKTLLMGREYFTFVFQVESEHILSISSSKVFLYGIIIPKIKILSKPVTPETIAYVFAEHCTEFTGKLCSKCGYSCKQNCSIISRN